MTEATVYLTIGGFVLLSILMLLKVRMAMLLSIVLVTLVGIPLGVTMVPTDVSLGDVSLSATFLQLDFKGLFNPSGEISFWNLLSTPLMVVISFTLVASEKIDSYRSFGRINVQSFPR